MKKTYHFCAMHQANRYVDGVVESDRSLSENDNYEKLKDVIGLGFTPPVAGREITVLSLTVV